MDKPTVAATPNKEKMHSYGGSTTVENIGVGIANKNTIAANHRETQTSAQVIKKDGIGKTTTIANLGVGLAMRNNKVVLVDTDTQGPRNLDLLLGLENRIMYDLADVTTGRVPYKKALVHHKKYENLFLLPSSQMKDAVTLEQLVVLCKELRKEFDCILIECPSSFEGLRTVTATADCAIVVTMPYISAVRDTDKIIGLSRAGKDKIKLIVNRIRPHLAEKGDMLSMEDINDILSLPCIGQVPDDDMVVSAANQGEPVITVENSQAGKAYRNIVRRICGEDVPFMTFEKEGFWKHIKRRFGIEDNFISYNGPVSAMKSQLGQVIVIV